MRQRTATRDIFKLEQGLANLGPGLLPVFVNRVLTGAQPGPLISVLCIRRLSRHTTANLGQRLCDPQRQKYLRSGPLEKKLCQPLMPVTLLETELIMSHRAAS